MEIAASVPMRRRGKTFARNLLTKRDFVYCACGTMRCWKNPEDVCTHVHARPRGSYRWPTHAGLLPLPGGKCPSHGLRVYHRPGSSPTLAIGDPSEKFFGPFGLGARKTPMPQQEPPS